MAPHQSGMAYGYKLTKTVNFKYHPFLGVIIEFLKIKVNAIQQSTLIIVHGRVSLLSNYIIRIIKFMCSFPY